MKRKNQLDAKYLLFLLELFDKSLALTDILTMDISLLTSLEELKIGQIEREAQAIKASQKRPPSTSELPTITNG